jgi:hypothetical protein
MSHNWEYGLSFVKEGYISFCGDDDGFLPDALSQVNEYINEYKVKVVQQLQDGYSWPNFADPLQRNRLCIHLGNDFEIINSRQMLDRAFGEPKIYWNLPIIYKAFADIEVINKVKATANSGSFFKSMIPDVYSGIAIASVVDSYGLSHKAFALNGASGHSGGTAAFSPLSDTTPAETFLSESTIPFHEKLSFAPNIPIILAESILQAQDNNLLPDYTLDLEMVLKSAVETCFRDGRMGSVTFDRVKSAIVEIGRKNNLGGYAEKLIASGKLSASRSGFVQGLDIFNKRISIDASEFGVGNVYEAAVLHGRLRDELIRKYTRPLQVLRATCGLVANELKRYLNV